MGSENIGNTEKFSYCPICASHISTMNLEGTERPYCMNCGFIRFRNPSPSTGTIAVKDGKIVMIQRGRPPSKGKWAFPSGFIEMDETPEEAALREMEEESGMTGEILDLIGVYYEKSELWGDLLVIMYLVNVTGGEMMAGDDAVDARLFTKDEIPLFKFQSFRQSWEQAQQMFADRGITLE
jgi:8-oxo-dGTP diphosphatase